MKNQIFKLISVVLGFMRVRGQGGFSEPGGKSVGKKTQGQNSGANSHYLCIVQP